MIPTIEDILKEVCDGRLGYTDALALIEHHLLTATENANPFSEDPAALAAELNDRIRNGFINAMLHSLPRGGADSENVAHFVWDTAQRLMDKRARDVPFEPVRLPEPPPETLEQKVARLEKDAARWSLEAGQDTMRPAHPKDPDQTPWTPREAIVDELNKVQGKTWGDGSKYPTDVVPGEYERGPSSPERGLDPTVDNKSADTEHDDGPF